MSFAPHGSKWYVTREYICTKPKETEEIHSDRIKNNAYMHDECVQMTARICSPRCITISRFLMLCRKSPNARLVHLISRINSNIYWVGYIKTSSSRRCACIKVVCPSLSVSQRNNLPISSDLLLHIPHVICEASLALTRHLIWTCVSL